MDSSYDANEDYTRIVGRGCVRHIYDPGYKLRLGRDKNSEHNKLIKKQLGSPSCLLCRTKYVSVATFSDSIFIFFILNMVLGSLLCGLIFDLQISTRLHFLRVELGKSKQ